MRTVRIIVLGCLTLLAGVYAFDVPRRLDGIMYTPAFQLVDIGWTSSRVLHRTYLNNRSQVVGMAREGGEFRRYIWDPVLGFTYLPDAPFPVLHPTGVTSSNTVYGFALTSRHQPAQHLIEAVTTAVCHVWAHFEAKFSASQAFLWNASSGYVFPASGELTSSVIETVNGKGQAILASLEQTPEGKWTKKSFLWQEGKALEPIELDVPPGAVVSITSLSDGGELAGEWILASTDPEQVLATPCLPTRVWHVYMQEGVRHAIPVNADRYVLVKPRPGPGYHALLRTQFYWSEKTGMVEIPATPTDRFQFFMWTRDGELIGFRGKGIGSIATWKPEQKLEVTEMARLSRPYRKLVVNRKGEYAADFGWGTEDGGFQPLVLKPIQAWWKRVSNLVAQPSAPAPSEFEWVSGDTVIDLDRSVEGLDDWSGVELLALNENGVILAAGGKPWRDPRTGNERRRTALFLLVPNPAEAEVAAAP